MHQTNSSKPASFTNGCLTFQTLICAALTVTFCGNQLAAQQEDSRTDIDQIIARELANRAALKRLNCEFTVTTGKVESEEKLRAGEFLKVTGNAHGKWIVFDDAELFHYEVGDVFEIRPAGEDQPNTAYAPFPGGETTLRTPEYVLSLGHMIGSGRIGPASSTFTGDTFHPRYTLGGFGSDQYIDPIQWLLDPPGNVDAKLWIEQQAKLPESVVRINSQLPGESIVIQYDFDQAAGGTLTRLMSLENGELFGNLYHVSESMQVGKGGPFIPKLAYLIFDYDGEFPKSAIRFDITKVLDEIKPKDLAIVINEPVSYPIYTTDSPVLRSFLSQGDRITPKDLEALYEKAQRRKPWREATDEKSEQSESDESKQKAHSDNDK